MGFDIDHGFGLHGGEAALPGGATPDLVWRHLAHVAGVQTDEQLPTAGTVAARLNQPGGLASATLYEQLGELVASASGDEPGDNLRRASDLVQLLDTAVLADAIAAGKNISHRKWLLQALLGLIATPAILPLMRAAALAYEQPLSGPMNRLLEKAQRTAELPVEGGAEPADVAYREFTGGLVETWSAGSVDTTGTGYDSVFGESRTTADGSASATVAAEPDRIIALAFETGALGGAVWHALAQLGSSDRGARHILDMLKAAPDTRAAEMVAQQVATPARLANLLREETPDFDAVDALLARMNEAAGGALLDALIDARSTGLRGALLQRVSTLGTTICPLVLERLRSEARPAALRDLLMVVREAGCDTRDVPLDRFVQHPDVRVRREAVRLLLADPIVRDRAVVAALRDPDTGMLKVGLQAAREGLPEAAVPVLAKRVVDPKFPAEYRTSVLHLLSQSQSVLALEVLLGYAVGGKTLLGKAMLAPKSPEMLIALSGLARTWSDERRVADLLGRARKSADPEIANALSSAPQRIALPDLDDADDE